MNYELFVPLQPMTNEELRKKYNPDGSLLRRQQLRMLDILSEVDRICKKHDIPYWLSSGTLIGAMRHNGFIPWDDDLDIEMMRKDYLRLMKVLPKELPEWLVLQNDETDLCAVRGGAGRDHQFAVFVHLPLSHLS